MEPGSIAIVSLRGVNDGGSGSGCGIVSRGRIVMPRTIPAIPSDASPADARPVFEVIARSVPRLLPRPRRRPKLGAGERR